MAEMAGPGAAQRVVIVAPQSGQAVSVGRGEQVRVVDPDGRQVGDMWAIDVADRGRWLSASHTRDRCERLFPAVGEQFRDQYGEPVLQLAADTSPGVHDMLFPPCDRWLYESRGLPGHVNCRDNFLAAVASAGISLPVVPDPVNLFQSSGPQPDGRLRIGVAASRPGDAISFFAQRDLVRMRGRLPATQQRTLRPAADRSHAHRGGMNPPPWPQAGNRPKSRQRAGLPVIKDLIRTPASRHDRKPVSRVARAG
jgi:uncharacterized protein